MRWCEYSRWCAPRSTVPRRLFLAADRRAARNLVERDQVIDSLHGQAETTVLERLVCPEGTTERQRHHLLLILRILPELERSGDLAEHIASHAAQGLAEWLTPRAKKLVAQMGSLGSEMWDLATEAFARRDGSVGRHPAGARRRDR